VTRSAKRICSDNNFTVALTTSRADSQRASETPGSGVRGRLVSGFGARSERHVDVALERARPSESGRAVTKSIAAVVGLTAAMSALLLGCGGGHEERTSEASRRTSTTARESVPDSSDGSGPLSETGTTQTPPLDSGVLGPGTVDRGGRGGGAGTNRGGGSGNGGGAGGGGGGGGGASGGNAVVIVGGPTLSDDYPEHWGNLYLTDPSQCAVFTNDSDHQIIIRSVSVPSPLVLVTDCSPDGQGRSTTGCTAGLALPAAGGCVAGIQFAPGTDLTKNYTGDNNWDLSQICTDTASPPCSEKDVAARHPSVTSPVEVWWTVTLPIRFCGATDYADDQGNPGGAGSNPRNGCTAPSPEQPSRATGSLYTAFIASSLLSHGHTV